MCQTNGSEYYAKHIKTKFAYKKFSLASYCPFGFEFFLLMVNILKVYINTKQPLPSVMVGHYFCDCQLQGNPGAIRPHSGVAKCQATNPAEVCTTKTRDTICFVFVLKFL